MKRLTLVALVALYLTSPACAADGPSPSQLAQNWHQWRGPLANGVAPEANPPLEWDETKNVKWKVPIEGESTATPIVWGDQIFLTSAVMTDRTVELEEGAKAPNGPFRISKPANYYQFVVTCVDRDCRRKAVKDHAHCQVHLDALYRRIFPGQGGILTIRPRVVVTTGPVAA